MFVEIGLLMNILITFFLFLQLQKLEIHKSYVIHFFHNLFANFTNQ